MKNYYFGIRRSNEAQDYKIDIISANSLKESYNKMLALDSDMKVYFVINLEEVSIIEKKDSFTNSNFILIVSEENYFNVELFEGSLEEVAKLKNVMLVMKLHEFKKCLENLRESLRDTSLTNLVTVE